MPFVILVDKRKLGGLQAPRHWRDLLEPEFQGKVIIPGAEDHVVDVPLLYCYREHGLKGVARLAANVKAVWHPARMARTAGTSNPEGVDVPASERITEERGVSHRGIYHGTGLGAKKR
ncbi:MAG: hypothetical protein A4E65_03388 [Syntrophorhabdus sp. PtaU1.Bin153]|nr:MAG: hypothetical protein A4E65_03388 [Syntrophorhabdus sp. PtaU1.Bin153]